jgi:ABC-type Fe3+ transport system substrate-binding protein
MAAARRLHTLVLAAALLAATPSLAADAALIEAAKREGEVTWYTTQIINQFGRPAIDLFQKSYGIKVTVLRGDAVELAARLISEAGAGRVAADVFDGTSNAPALKKAGIALQWLPDAAQKLPPAYRDAEGYWVATNLYVHTPTYNTDLVPRDSAPQSWQDLLDPKWRGKLAWASHATTSSAPGFIGLVLGELGEEKGRAYLEKLAQQRIVPVAGSARALVDQTIAGEYPIVLQVFNHQPVVSARLGAPVDWIRMSPAMAILSVAGVVRGAPHPNAGKLLVDFFLSRAAQEIFRDGDYIPADPEVAPRDPALRPDGTRFRATFYSPEEIDVGMPHWVALFNQLFK